MTERAYEIDRAVLAYLAAQDGAPMLEAIVHGAVQQNFRQENKIPPSLDEMDQSFARLNAKRWVVGLPTIIKGSMKWAVNDNGRAALLQMQNE